MTFRNLSNTYGSSHQPLHIAVDSGSLCSTLHNSQQLQQHQLTAGAGEHLCTRFCCFEPLFGNVFRCQTSGITHVCDQGCSERIFLDNHFDICRYCFGFWARLSLHCHAVLPNKIVASFAGSAKNCSPLRSTQRQPAKRGALMTVAQGASTRGQM